MKSDINIEYLNDLDNESYYNFLFNESDSTIFHTIEWYNILNEHLGFKLFFLVANDRDNNIHGILPLFYVKNWVSNRLESLPFSQYGGYIGDKKYLKPIIKKTIELKEKIGCNRIVIKQPPFSNVDKNIFEEAGMGENDNLDQYLLLKNPEILWQEFSESTRRAINKALKKDIVVKRVTEESEIKEVYNLLINFAKRVGFLEFSYKDYLKIWKKLNTLGYFEIFIAKLNKKIISFMAFLNFKDIVLYKIGTSTAEGRNLGAHRLITWNAIKWSYSKGYKIFDFGPSGPLNEDGDVMEKFQGLVDYKSFFNSIKLPYSWYYYPRTPVFINPIQNKTLGVKIREKILKNTPRLILKRNSTFIIKKFI